jgi:hypothetical protein
MPLESPAGSCSYELDRRLVITGLGPGWDRTAIEHGAPELVSPWPIGKPLWMYLTDATTVHLYELLFERAIDVRRPITFPIRCDGPARRRFLELSILATPTRGFFISTILVRSEPRQPIALLERGVKRRPESLFICSWCNRAKVKERWVEVEEAVRLLRLFERDEPPQLQHAVCDACRRFMLTMLADDSKLPLP